MDEFSRHAIKISIAHICQYIGWSKINSTPLEVLTDLYENYIIGLGKLANNYATLMGHSEPNLTHVALAFRDANISYQELKEYMTYFKSGAALEVPKYPIHKESHLNHLKPGSREVLTRPPHIHEHLPPMYPNLEIEEPIVTKLPSYDETPSESIPSHQSSRNGPDSSFEEWNENPFESDNQQLRELSSVLMTSSGYLSSAREGKLPEVRSYSSDVLQIAEYNAENLDVVEKKTDKENWLVENITTEHKKPDKKSKHKKLKKSDCDNPELLDCDTKKDLAASHLKNKAIYSPAKELHDDYGRSLFAKSTINDSSIDSTIIDSDHGYTTKLGDDSFPYSKYLNQLPTFSNKERGLPSYVQQVSTGLNDNFEDVDVDIDIENSNPMNCYPYSSHSTPVIKSERESPVTDIECKRPDINLDLNLSPGVLIRNENHENEVEGKRKPEILSPEVRVEPESPLNIETDGLKANNFYTNVFDFEKPLYLAGKINGLSPPANLAKPLPRPLTGPMPVCSSFHGDISPHIKKKKNKKNKIERKIKYEVKNDAVKLSKPKSKKKKKDHKREKDGSSTFIHSSGPSLTPVPSQKTHFREGPNINGFNYDGSFKPVTITSSEKDIEPVLSSPKLFVREPLSISSNKISSKKTKVEEKKKEKRKDKEMMKLLSEDFFSFDPIKRVKKEEKPKSVSPVPKITFKLGPSPPVVVPEPKTQKIVIKPILKKDNKESSGNLEYQGSNINGPAEPICQPPQKISCPLLPGQSQPMVSTDQAQIWICPACNLPDDGSPMIACDLCDLWFHWICVGIREAIEGDWYCKMCLAKKEQDKVREKKKKHKKKKI